MKKYNFKVSLFRNMKGKWYGCQDILDVTKEKANQLKELAVFQKIPSIGYELADKLVFHLNVYSLEDVKNENPTILFNQLEKCLGVWTDAYVEEQIHCVVNYANNPNTNKKWFDFTKEKKKYREKLG